MLIQFRQMSTYYVNQIKLTLKKDDQINVNTVKE